MDRQLIISMAKTVALEAQKEETRQMEESLWADNEAYADKVKECSRLKAEKQDMLAEEAPKEKFVDEFMVFLEAVDNEDLDTVKSFDEKAMMHTIKTMTNNNSGDIMGLVAALYGDNLNMIRLGLELEAKDLEDLPADIIFATVKTDGNCGGAGAMVVAAIEGPNSESNEA